MEEPSCEVRDPAALNTFDGEAVRGQKYELHQRCGTREGQAYLRRPILPKPHWTGAGPIGILTLTLKLCVTNSTVM